MSKPQETPETKAIKDELHNQVQKIITDKELNDLLDEQVEWFSHLQETPEDTLTMLGTFTRKTFGGEITKSAIVGMPEGLPEDQDEKEKMFEKIGSLLAQEAKKDNEGSIIANVFISEAWFMDPKHKQDPNRRISEHTRAEGKREGVVISINTLDGRVAMKTLMIERGKDGNMTKITDHTYTPYDYKSKNRVESYIMMPFWKGVKNSRLSGKQ